MDRPLSGWGYGLAMQLRCRVCPNIADHPPLPQACKEVLGSWIMQIPDQDKGDQTALWHSQSAGFCQLFPTPMTTHEFVGLADHTLTAKAHTLEYKRPQQSHAPRMKNVASDHLFSVSSMGPTKEPYKGGSKVGALQSQSPSSGRCFRTPKSNLKVPTSFDATSRKAHKGGGLRAVRVP